MNELTALTVFNITVSEKEAVEERYAEICFELKGFFLKNHPVPQLIDARIKKLHQLEEARCSLLTIPFEFPGFAVFVPDSVPAVSWKTFFESYNRQLAHLRLSLSQSKTAFEIARVLQEMKNAEENYYSHWIYFFKEINEELFVPLVPDGFKISSAPDTLLLAGAFEELASKGLSVDAGATCDVNLWMKLQKEARGGMISVIAGEMMRIKKLTSPR
ncbi:MAG: hypothetical protein ACOZCO_13050 [Bacteroidota bacterium]